MVFWMNCLSLLRKINLSSAVIKPAILLLCGRDVPSEMKNAFILKNRIKLPQKNHDHHHHKVYMKLYRGWLRPNFTMVYCVWKPQIWVPKLMKVIKKIVKQTQIVPSSSLMHCNN